MTTNILEVSDRAEILGLPDLTEVESRLVEAAANGEVFAVEVGAEAGVCVRAAVIAALCTEPALVDRRGVRLRGVEITGTLDLSHAVVEAPVALTSCVFADGGVQADQAHLRRLTMSGTQMLHAGPDGLTLDLSDATVDGDLELDHGFSSSGQVSLAGARVRGEVSLRGASISVPEGVALDAEDAAISRGVEATDGLSVVGEVRLRHCRVGGDLSLDAATLSNRGGTALDANHTTIAGDVDLTDGFHATGSVRFRNARIGGTLRASSATLECSHAPAFDADSIETGGDLLLYDSTIAGSTRLIAGDVGDCLELRGSALQSEDEPALVADGISVAGVIRLDEGLEAIGQVRLAAAAMSQLVCRDVALSNPGKVALMARGIVVRGEVLMNRELQVDGELQLSDASIGTRLDLAGAVLHQPRGVALQMAGTRIGGDLVLPGLSAHGDVVLEAAAARELILEGGSWTRARVSVRGFEYGTIVPGPDEVSVASRLDWLRSSGSYVPGAFDVLAEAYQQAGHESAAQDVRVAKQRERRKGLKWHERLIDGIWDVSVVYGYSSWRALAALAALMPLVGLAFVGVEVGGREGAMIYVGDQGSPPFYPWIYAADLVIPIVDLRQASLWAATGWRATLAAGATAAGWVLTTTAAVGLSGILARRD